MNYTDFRQFDTVPRDKYAAPKKYVEPVDQSKRGYAWCATCRCMVRPTEVIRIGKVPCLKCYIEGSEARK